MSVIKSLLTNDLPEGLPINRKTKKEQRVIPPCPDCGSVTVNETLDTSPSLQYSRLYCGDCGKFLQVGRDPAITAASEKRDKQILSILNNFELSHTEETFLNDQLYKRFATPKQRDWLDRIALKTLEKKFDWGAYAKRPG